MRRGRREDDQLKIGDAVDFWRVQKFVAGKTLRLRAEMKVPGRAWLEFEVQPTETGSVVRQTAIFDPVGVFGLAYWYALYPLHQLVFAGMLRNICASASSTDDDQLSAATQTYTSQWDPSADDSLS